MKRLLTALLTALAALLTVEAGVPTLPFSEVQTGMKGTGRTVFQGSEIETFQVEILGKLPNIGPRQNLILGRCSGGPLAETGILAGMSGSPVYVDGKLIGAVAYSWGFAKDAIAGITPIEEMLEVASLDEGPRGRRPAAGLSPADLLRLQSPAELPLFLSSTLSSVLPRPARGTLIHLPVSVAGISAEGFSRMAPALHRSGLLPVQGGGAGRNPSPASRLEPGSPIGLKLARGDVDLTATGTVTWVDGDRVLAFGHPLFGLGRVDLPLSGARVEALLPSLSQSLRLATPLAELGALQQDRAAAVYGKMGASASMIPVRLQLSSGTGEPQSYSFDIADDALLAPLLLYSSLNGILANAERSFGNITVRLENGSIIKLADREDVELDNIFAGATAPYYATGTSAFILYLLMNNDWARPSIAGVNLILGYTEHPKTAKIRRITLDRYRVHAGETLHATILLTPYRGPDLVLSHEIEIPAETPPGRLVLHVGGALAVSRAEGSGEPPIFPRDLDQLIWLINRLRRNDRVYIVASLEDTGVFLGGARLPNLPPSVTSILSRPRSLGNFAMMPQRGILEEEILTDYSVEGLTRVQVEVEAP